ncbi:response regulator, partial [Paenibacillus sp. MCAF20]
MSYQILLVDDEAHAIEGVKSDLDLAKLQISNLFTAWNIRKAKEILEQERIDILLCDIEMPHGSGLELQAWLREHQPHIVTIFLTSHADFKYAKEALKLGSLDYLLKPVMADELEGAIRKAQELIDRNGEISRNSQSHQLWMKHHSYIIEKFWLDLIYQSIPNDPDAIREQVERHHIPMTEESIFLPVLISVQRWNKELKSRDEKILEYALLNSAEEIVINNEWNGICFELDNGMLLVILVASQGTEWDQDRLLHVCRQY